MDKKQIIGKLLEERRERYQDLFEGQISIAMDRVLVCHENVQKAKLQLKEAKEALNNLEYKAPIEPNLEVNDE